MKIFKEEQRFNQPWLIILILLSVLLSIGIILKTYLNNPRSYSNIELILKIGFIILLGALIFLFKLNTRIDEKGIHYQFFPFHWSFIVVKWSEIDSAYVRNYRALYEYGGWGLRSGTLWNKSKGKAINVSGNIGIQLKLKNGKKLLIGTQKQNDAKSVLATYKRKFN